MPHLRPYRTGTYEGLPCRHGHGTTRYNAGGACVVCSKEKSKQRWRDGTKKPGKYDPTYRRARNLQHNYGMTEDDFAKMLWKQQDACALCEGPPTGKSKRFHVDHDHATGKVRGLLCGKCNVGLGSFDDSPLKLRLALLYLDGRI